jgi:L-lactate dehydrogenase
MKVGIVGAGSVGSACAVALAMRGCAGEIVLVNRTRKRAKAVATDIRYGLPLSPLADIGDGDYKDLAGAALVMIAAGVNEKAGGATDRNDPSGRLRLLDANAGIYEEIVPRVVHAAPDAVLLVVTDPPDPLADLARTLARHDRVLSTGTFLDSLRFRVHVAQRLAISPNSVDAQVIGEHGTSQVYLWSSARIAGVPVLHALAQRNLPVGEFRQSIEQEVRFANISIIEGNEASQFGIGMVSARIAEIILRDERAVIPVGFFHSQYGTTFSLPSIVGRAGVVRVLEPEMAEDERSALRRSAETLKSAASRVVGRPRSAISTS